MSIQDLADFVAQQRKDEQSSRSTREQVKQTWVENLSKLYDDVEAYLSEFVSAGSIVLERQAVTINEEQLGSYDVNKLIVRMAARDVELRPIGAYVIGACGRVDMVGPFDTRKLVLLPKSTRRVTFRVTDTRSGVRPSSEQGSSQDDLVWKIVSGPRADYTDVDEDTFADALLQVSRV